MAALTAARDIKSFGPGPLAEDLRLKMKASTTIYAGGLVVVDGTTGLAEPATAAASKFVAGVAQETVKSASSGDYFVPVKRGRFLFANKATDLVGDALILRDCYIEDDQTVRATGTGSSAAGKVIAIRTDGVIVETYSTGS